MHSFLPDRKGKLWLEKFGSVVAFFKSDLRRVDNAQQISHFFLECCLENSSTIGIVGCLSRTNKIAR